MRFAWSLLGILGSLMQNSPNRSQAAFRPGSRIRFIGRGFISPRRGTSTHHSAGSGPLPRRAGRWVRSLLTKFSGSFESLRTDQNPEWRRAGAGARHQRYCSAGRRLPRRIGSDAAIAPPAGFERFCQRLLRESGFQEVTITGRSGDGGIDGIGMLQVNALVSFKVLFQCKKYAGSVTPSHVRDFRGAMTGRADKGIIITTGSFTSEARKEAVRDGAPPIELVDGEKLTGMLEKLELGLRPRQTFEVDAPFFEGYKK